VSAAVVDTNILVSALLRPDGPPGRVAAALTQGRLQPVVCAAIVDEYDRVLRRPAFGFDPADVGELVSLLTQQALSVEVPPYAPAELMLPDPADWPFAACALAVPCPLITGNARHFPARLGIAVMTARQWVEAFAS